MFTILIFLNYTVLTVTLPRHPSSHPSEEQYYCQTYGFLTNKRCYLKSYSYDNSVRQKTLTHGRDNSHFRFTSGVWNLENYISDFRNYHKRMQHKILGGFLGRFFEIWGLLVRQKSISVHLGKKYSSWMLTVLEMSHYIWIMK